MLLLIPCLGLDKDDERQKFSLDRDQFTFFFWVVLFLAEITQKKLPTNLFHQFVGNFYNYYHFLLFSSERTEEKLKPKPHMNTNNKQLSSVMGQTCCADYSETSLRVHKLKNKVRNSNHTADDDDTNPTLATLLYYKCYSENDHSRGHHAHDTHHHDTYSDGGHSAGSGCSGGS